MCVCLCMSVCVSVCRNVHLSVRVCVCRLHVRMSVCHEIWPVVAVCRYLICVRGPSCSIGVSVRPSVCPPLHVSVRTSRVSLFGSPLSGTVCMSVCLSVLISLSATCTISRSVWHFVAEAVSVRFRLSVSAFVCASAFFSFLVMGGAWNKFAYGSGAFRRDHCKSSQRPALRRVIDASTASGPRPRDT